MTQAGIETATFRFVAQHLEGESTTAKYYGRLQQKQYVRSYECRHFDVYTVHFFGMDNNECRHILHMKTLTLKYTRLRVFFVYYVSLLTPLDIIPYLISM